MRKHLLATAALLPATALATALPASAATIGDATSAAQVKAASVTTHVQAGAAPLFAIRSTGQTCSGTLVARKTLSDKGKVLGELDVYHKTSNKGTLIACFKHAGVTKGKRLATAVSIGAVKPAAATAAAKRNTTVKPAVQVTAQGNFVSWAGPAVVGGAKGQCAVAAGGVQYMGKAYVVTSGLLCGR